ncbi:PIN domain-containing protein [Thiohalocapsa marina]|uniref:PIN domain-containing protein n=1 Tax=Thiohalocapsa marina TaxID=424902 RepID=A0A5M8FBY3_9GAMM|nr:PIN domain-containing protein [Thiohalocapsa marina]KAA6182217.1 PIN domain-containing protein [Thiohalocapsa marina]
MPSIVVDSGPLIALFDGSDQYHARAVGFLRGLRHPLVTNLPVITEVVYMLDFAPQAQRDFLFWAEGALTIDTETSSDLSRIRALLEKYSDLPADFADVSLVALCERLRITTVASVDSDFTIYRMQDRRGFRNLFFEDG